MQKNPKKIPDNFLSRQKILKMKCAYKFWLRMLDVCRIVFFHLSFTSLLALNKLILYNKSMITVKKTQCYAKKHSRTLCKIPEPGQSHLASPDWYIHSRKLGAKSL